MDILVRVRFRSQCASWAVILLTQLLDVFSFLSVLLRGCALALESLILGGAIFAVWILRPLRKKWGSQVDAVVQSSRRLIFWSAVALALIQLCYLGSDSSLLVGTTGLGWLDLAGATFFIAGLTSAAAAVVVA